MKETRKSGKAAQVAAPLYVRWEADKSPYAIELKLELISRLREALSQAASTGVEIGGVLVGLLPSQRIPTLRIEEFEFLPRRSGDGTTFILEGGGERFAEVRRNARARERSSVGIFRSHLRPGSLRPSLADRTLLATEFKEPVYALLLVQGNAPFTAAFFVASHGPLSGENAVREFKLDPDDFCGLPEIESDSPGSMQTDQRNRWLAWTGYGVVICSLLLVAAVLAFLNQSIFFHFPTRSSVETFGVTVKRSDKSLVRISWNHDREAIAGATAGTLIVRANGDEKRIALGLDDLRLGSVVIESERMTGRIELSITGGPQGARRSSAAWGR